MSWLRTLAAGAAAPIYPSIGAGMLAEVEQLFASAPGLRRAASPRDAALLLVAGDIPAEARPALDRLHDQLPHPRRTLAWKAGEPSTQISARLNEAWRDLAHGAPSEPDRLPDEPPNPWRGIGPHGQGGKGMMGGTPRGRPMAMTGADIRDGLELDRYTARVGPFAPMLPPGLTLELTLQGDVIVEAHVLSLPFPQPEEADLPALCAARMLRLLGLEGAADRMTRGHAPRAAWIRGAVPAGLGAWPGAGDARDRLDAWLSGRQEGGAPRDPARALPGLEWHEATLLLASFAPGTLRRALAEAQDLQEIPA
ncbi:hypothetical protein BV394_05140 [Brevirhabdus pacifica]|uniref:Uncharacterized protein n=1 Tax=Brevirhabdus pacifica TaxID=1267768 RepID=A0A1U7DGQ6_9RHOB|nr:hypothetical protein [Brevirhabdus pacifica]APX89177.1 hypothetical protein BV394_05140 [Brevirhabdus pacifica]PJJ86227.1 hypothetical protein CLV77_0762 [Brevirhabdus pacifica]